jgi:heterodisulfide reductase subunit A
MGTEQTTNTGGSGSSNGKVGAIVVVGGGIAGMQAALDAANSGFKVYLVEKKPSIGGNMAQLDKTFPTNDCSTCMISPKLIEVAKHPNIEILSYAEVEGISGPPGNFKVKVRKKARYVDESICTGCATCVDNCPIQFKPQFNQGAGAQKEPKSGGIEESEETDGTEP